MKAVRDGLDITITDRFRKWHYMCRITYVPDYDAFMVHGRGLDNCIAATQFDTLSGLIYEAMGYKEAYKFYALKFGCWSKGIHYFNEEIGFVKSRCRGLKFDVSAWLTKRNKKLIGWALRDVYHQVREEYGNDLAIRYNRAVYSTFGGGYFVGGLDDETFARDVIKDRKLAAIANVSYNMKEVNHLISKAYKSRSWRRSRLPGGITRRVFRGCVWCAYNLTRPLDKLIEWVAFYCVSRVARSYDWPGNGNVDVLGIFNRSSVEQMWKAYRIAAGRLHLPEKTRRCKDMVSAFMYICDPHPGEWPLCGSLVALAEYSVEWHRRKILLSDELRKKKFPDLPVPLPQDKRVTWLSTGAALEEEGIEMSNCVASYARYAMSGQSYLFRFIDEDGRATVEVHPDGHVTQSYGPNNTTTSTSKRAARVLGSWGKQLAEVAV